MAVVQFRIDESTYASLGRFRASVTAAVQEALQEPRPELVVFPEYTAVFLALLPYTGELRGAVACFAANERAPRDDRDPVPPGKSPENVRHDGLHGR